MRRAFAADGSIIALPSGRWLGVALLLASAAVFPLAPPGAFGVVAFAACFVPGLLLALGVVGADHRVRRALRSHPADIARRELIPVEDRRSFGYPNPSPVARTLLGILAMGLLAGGLLAAEAMPGSWYDRAAVALPLLAAGVSIPVFVMVRARTRFLALPEGLQRLSPLGRVEIPWDRVVALSVTGIPLGDVSLAGAYRVYAPGCRIVFRPGLDGADELAGIAAGATGLRWR